MFLRDRDHTGDSTLEERRYFCQNWRADVSAVLTATGEMAQWAHLESGYSAYGVPIGLPAGDTDSDGDFDAADDSAILGGGTYDVRKDSDLNGAITSKDSDSANSHLGTYYTLGRGSSWAWVSAVRKGYAGYEFDPSLAGAKWHVRHRVLVSELGRWTRRDPLGYVDGLSLFAYGLSSPLGGVDTYGLQWAALCSKWTTNCTDGPPASGCPVSGFPAQTTTLGCWTMNYPTVTPAAACTAMTPAGFPTGTGSVPCPKGGTCVYDFRIDRWAAAGTIAGTVTTLPPTVCTFNYTCPSLFFQYRYESGRCRFGPLPTPEEDTKNLAMGNLVSPYGPG